MRISCAFAGAPEDEAGRWVDALRAALPSAAVALWRTGDPPADYAVVWRPGQPFFDAQPGLKAVFNAGAGVDALTALRLPAGVPVVRLEDAGMAEQMSDYVTHAVLHHYRQFGRYAEQAAASTWQPRPPRAKADCPVGILGFGVLGRAVAATLRGLGFTVQAWAASAHAAEGLQVHTGAAGLAALLGEVRILICLLPLTERTRHILNAENLGRLRPGAYLVNVARGAHLVEADLLAALASGQLCGATLDVFETEPLDASHPFWRHPAIRVTPHVSAATLRPEAVAQIAEKIGRLERGLPVSGGVDLSRGY